MIFKRAKIVCYVENNHETIREETVLYGLPIEELIEKAKIIMKAFMVKNSIPTWKIYNTGCGCYISDARPYGKFESSEFSVYGISLMI